ncbi:MAG TPA: DUF1194 domain-containing protein [Micropepsaceae bacterium]|nr:DUF1194 domain-containing protein [Micropepsaceae bacterium]
MTAWENAWRLGCATLAVCLVGSSAAGGPAGQHVDVALVIATDVSYSVDENEAHFQRQGAVTAFRNPDVVKAIQAGSLGRIAVAYLDFSSYQSNKILVDWTIIHDKASADAFADVLASKSRTLGVQTSISSGLELAEQLLETSGLTASKRVIDVSGDGPNNEGHLVDKVRDEIVAKGIVINGLPIMTPADQFDVYYLPDLDKYYAGCVIGGPGAFIQVAHGFEDIARALRRKLILEISDASGLRNPLLVPVAATTPGTTQPHAAHTPHAVYEKGCDIGERMRFGGN